MKQSNDKPVLALTLGDPAGVGAELIARLVARPETLCCVTALQRSLRADKVAFQSRGRRTGAPAPTCGD